MKTANILNRSVSTWARVLATGGVVFLTTNAYATLEDDFVFSDSTIWGYSGPGGDLVIPATIHGANVLTINRDVFFGSTNLTSVTLPDTLIRVGSRAFAYCTSLTNFVISESVTFIEDGAIAGCVNLESITVMPGSAHFAVADGVLFNFAQTDLAQYPAGRKGDYTVNPTVTTIRSWAFRGAEWLENIHIGEGVSGLGVAAFSDCARLLNFTVSSNNAHLASLDGVLFNKDLTQLQGFPPGRSGAYHVPDSVDGIAAYAFNGAGQLTSVNIPHGVSTIGSYAFAGCPLIETIVLPETLHQIGHYAFAQCENLQQAVVLGTNTIIESYVFQNATALVSVELAEGVHTIGTRAFQNCQSLSSIHIPASAVSLGPRLFPYCVQLTNITVAAGNPNFSSRSGVLFNNDQTELKDFATGLTGDYRIPSGVQSIASYAFSQSSGLTRVFLPNSISVLERQAFDRCDTLSAVLFDGNRPVDEFQVFSGSEQVRAYRRAGATGWSSTFADRPVFTWPEFMRPQVEGSTMNVEAFVEPGQSLVLEHCTDLSSGVWVAVSTNESANGLMEFMVHADGPAAYCRIIIP